MRSEEEYQSVKRALGTVSLMLILSWAVMLTVLIAGWLL